MYEKHVHYEISYFRLLWRPNIGISPRRDEISTELYCTSEPGCQFQLKKPSVIARSWKDLLRSSLCAYPVPYASPYLSAMEQETLLCL